MWDLWRAARARGSMVSCNCERCCDQDEDDVVICGIAWSRIACFRPEEEISI